MKINEKTKMTADTIRIQYRSPAVVKTAGLTFYILLLLLPALLVGTTGCKPTEKNYRSAYDVAREKRDREERERADRQAEMGMTDAAMVDHDGVSTFKIDGRDVYARHVNFARGDSVAPYAVSVATFRMSSNAEAMASDLVEGGVRDARALKSEERWFLVIGSAPTAAGALGIMDGFTASRPDWQYVGQPGIMMIIGGSR